MGKRTGKPGPDPEDPTPEQLARLPELKDRARRIHLFSQGIDFLREAVVFAHASEEKIDAAVKSWVQVVLDYGPTAQAASDEDAGLSRPDPPSPRQPPSETVAPSDQRIAGMPGIHLENARDLLRKACQSIRAAADAAMEGEDVELPGEGVEHILVRLLKDELGLVGKAAARLRIHRGKVEEMEKFEQAEGKLTHRALRRERASKKVSEPARTDFLKGFLKALEKRGLKLDPMLKPLLDREIRRAVVQASLYPDLDRTQGRVKLT